MIIRSNPIYAQYDAFPDTVYPPPLESLSTGALLHPCAIKYINTHKTCIDMLKNLLPFRLAISTLLSPSANILTLTSITGLYAPGVCRVTNPRKGTDNDICSCTAKEWPSLLALYERGSVRFVGFIPG